jgi:hypothetical protein
MQRCALFARELATASTTRDIPLGPIEPVSLSIERTELGTDAASDLGVEVRAPSSYRAADLVLRALPRTARAGYPLCYRISCAWDCDARNSTDCQLSMAAALRNLLTKASLRRVGSSVDEALASDLKLEIMAPRTPNIKVSFDIPSDVLPGSHVSLCHVTVAGADLPVPAVPIPVISGIASPLLLGGIVSHEEYIAPCVVSRWLGGADCALVVPQVSGSRCPNLQLSVPHTTGPSLRLRTTLPFAALIAGGRTRGSRL